MACGCKNKQNQAQTQSPQQTQQTQQKSNGTIQEAIKKTVEKYYNKK